MFQKRDISTMLYRPDELPFGKSWEKWTTKWWQWFLSIPVEKHPACDKTGENAGVYQNDPNVWFIAGTTGGTAERIISIPEGMAALFPVINVTTSYLENPNLKTEDDMTAFVNSHMKDIAKKLAYIDGEEILISERNRVRSNPFEFTFPSNNIYGVGSGPTKGVGDGYWVFLKPLSSGIHTIRTSGACMSGRVRIDVNIKLTVKNIKISRYGQS